MSSRDKIRTKLQEAIKVLEAMTAFSHTNDCRYLEELGNPGICRKCGWLNPDKQLKLECGHTPLQHAKIQLEKLKFVLVNINQVPDALIELAEGLMDNSNDHIEIDIEVFVTRDNPPPNGYPKHPELN